jgi:Flp pilus assembly protein CpaB
VVALALLLAIGATAAVFLYVNGVKENAISSGDVTKVIVAQQDIPANTSFDPLIDQGVFVEKTIPTDAAVQDAVNSVDQLRGHTATVPILANEQIPTERLSGGQQVQGGRLGICEQCEAITVRVDGPPGVGGALAPGDNVTVFATFDGVAGFVNLRDLINKLNGGGTAAATSGEGLPPFTMTLEPTIKILKVENPDVTGTSERTSQGAVTITFDVPKEDSQYFVFAAEKATLYFGLLPPNQQGVQLPAQSISINRIFGKNQS